MENQEQLRSIDQNPFCHQMHGHVKTESSVHLPREINSSGDEYVTRVRKSYTLTKQRERWTEEEHKKFLEALQLYGRAWGQIEEHIGTKSAVQIRSHAQKFFSKVARESARTDGNGTVKSIHIPPPRPKRKPVHPYPRKLGNITNNGAPSLEELQRTLQTPTTCEPDDRSPVSVLSSAGTETLTSTSSNGQNGCISTVASASGTNDQDDRGQSPTMTVQEDNELSSVCEAMKDQPSSQMTSSEAHIPTLKLFGKTVEVTESDNSSTHDAGNEPQHSRTTLSLGVDHPANQALDFHSESAINLRSSPAEISRRDTIASAWNAYPGLVPPLFYYFPLVGGNSVDPVFLPPWWVMCGNSTFPVVNPQPDRYSQLGIEAQREGSCASISFQNVDGVNLKRIDDHELLPSSSLKRSSRQTDKSTSVSSGRGFVPYKRCALESEVQQPVTGRDENEGQSITLCL